MRNDEDLTADLKAAASDAAGIDIPCRVEVIASLFSLSVRRIQQLTQEGVLPTADVLIKGRKARRYMLIDTVRRYTAYLNDKINGKGKTDRMLELKEQKLEAEIALKEAQGELQNIKREIAVGRYIDTQEVELDYINFFVVFKKFCMSIPGRISGRISGSIDSTEARAIEKDLLDEVTQLLNSFVVAGTAKPKAGESVGKEV